MELTSRNRRRLHGFTLVEIMIAVIIIGLLAALAIPAFNKVRSAARNTRFISDLRTFSQAFEAYSATNGTWPADGAPGAVPAGMAGDFKEMVWTASTSLGGNWDWDYQQFGVTAGISVHEPTAPTSQLREIDRKIDDGDLMTGNFRARSSGFIYILEP